VTQLGAGLSTLLLGYVAADWAVSIFAGLPTAAAIAIGIAVATVAHLVLGEQIPRFLGTNHPAWISRGYLVRPLRVVAILLRPVLIPLSFVLDALAGALKLSRAAFYAPIHTPADIRELVR